MALDGDLHADEAHLTHKEDKVLGRGKQLWARALHVLDEIDDDSSSDSEQASSAHGGACSSLVDTEDGQGVKAAEDGQAHHHSHHHSHHRHDHQHHHSTMLLLEWRAVLKEVSLAEEEHWFGRGSLVAQQRLDQRLYELKKIEAARQLDRTLMKKHGGDYNKVRRHTHAHTQAGRQTDRQADRQTDTDRHRQTQTDRHGQTRTQTDTYINTQLLP